MDNTRLTKSTKKSKQIYDFIRSRGSVSKQDIVVGLKLSLPTVTQNLQYLTGLGLIDTASKILNTGGRSATAYTYDSRARWAIGVYLTARHITAISVDLRGELMGRIKEDIPFDLDSDAYLRRLGALVEQVKEETGIPDKDLLGVGVSVQGLVCDSGEEVTYGLALGCFTGKTREQIAKYIPYRCRLFHDAESSGFAEVWSSPDLEDAFYISLCNSVGGAVVVGNRIRPGDTGKGGEIGHMTVSPQGGERCYCGRNGCFETVCRATNLSSYTGGDLGQFFHLLQAGDKGAKALWRPYLEHLSLAIHNVRMLFNSTIILGGFVGMYIGPFMADLYPLVDARNPFGEASKGYLLPCKYKVESAAAGGAISYIDEFFDRL